MENPIFNVIIPIYNAEKFIVKTIESVLNQTYNNVNLLLVNDGSTDNSGKICDEYASKYSNIRVIHTSNQGASSARNNGLKVINSGFVAFLDSDDYIEPEMIEKIKEIAIHLNPDCIDFGFNYVSHYGNIIKNHNSIPKNVLLDKPFIDANILPPLLNINDDKSNFIYDFAWNKIYKKEIIDKFNISFIEKRSTWEDRPFVIDYVSHCTSYLSINEHFYNYNDVPNSLSRKYTNEFFDVILENYKMYKSKFGKQYDFETQYVYKYWCNSIENMIKRALSQSMVSRESVIEKINETLKDVDVKSLYENREHQNRVEEQIAKYIKEENTEKVIAYFDKIVKKENSNSIMKKISNKVKRVIKRK